MSQELPLLLIVDDVELNRAILSEVFSRQYRILEAETGRRAVELLEKNVSEISLVLLDNIMPEMDGFEVLEIMNRRDWIGRIPVIMISSENSEETILHGYRLGVSDFIGRPFSSNIVRRRVENIIELYRHKAHLERLVEEQMQKVRQANLFMIDTLGTVVEFRDGDSGGHVRRIRNISAALLEALAGRYPEYGLTPQQIDEISSAAALHDIGKIAVPDAILSKPGPLTRAEFEIMKTHTVKGVEILEHIDHVYERTYFRVCCQICRSHHERWDGGGYPDGLRGDEIPLSAQVVSLADAYDALTSERVYKPPYPHGEALRMIKDGECGMFNPRLLGCLLDIQDSLPARAEAPPQDKTPSELDLSGRAESEVSGRTLQLLEREREKYQTLAQLSGEIIFDYDTETGLITLSDKFGETFGQEIGKKNICAWVNRTDLLDADGRRQLLGSMSHFTPENPVWRAQMRMRTVSGEMEWFEVSMHTLWSGDTAKKCTNILGKLVNINDRMLETDRLREQANRDPLTGVYNARAARRLITAALSKRPSAAALLYLDVDNFKQVNDTRGHLFGDQVLRFVAETLQKRARSTDIVSRVGGDEFVVYLDSLRSGRDAGRIAGELGDCLRQKGEGLLSGSVGISCYPRDGKTYKELVGCADAALYAAKKDGKGGFAFYEEEMKEAFPSHHLFSEIDK